MSEILDFCDKFQFANLWASDIAKIVILYYMIKFVLLLFRVTSDLMKF